MLLRCFQDLVPVGHMGSNNVRVVNTAVLTVLAVDASVYCDQDSGASTAPDLKTFEMNEKLRVNTVTVLWQQDCLPSNSICILPLSGKAANVPATSHWSLAQRSPLGGAVLLVTLNAILVVAEESVFGLACNGFASSTVAKQIPLQSFYDAVSFGSYVEEGFPFSPHRPHCRPYLSLT